MGNGRYYTFRQFFEIAYLTLSSGITVFALTYIWIKARDKTIASRYVLALVGILFYFLLSFIKEVTYGLRAAYVLTGISYFGIFFFCWTGIYQSKKWIKGLVLVSGIFCTVAISVRRPEFSFFFHQLSPWLILSILSLYIWNLGIRINLFREEGLKSFKTKQEILVMVGYTYMTLSLVLIWATGVNGITIQYSVTTLPILYLLIFLKFMPEEKIPLGYHSAIEDMLDTMIIVSPDRDILFINDSQFADYIKKDTKVDFKHLEDLFMFQDISVVRLEERTIQLNGRLDNKLLSILVCLKPIQKGDQILGYIIVSTDCTHLEQMIVELNDTKEELKTKEKELLLYASTVKTLTSEKERQRLMQDVQNQLGHHLAELTTFLLNTKNKALIEERDHMISQIETAILMARRSLLKIRMTVVEYRETYEGKE